MIDNKKNNGFTLIELLVVISIIALLSSIILSAVQDARNRTQIRAMESDMVNLRTAIQLHREENNGAWPTAIASLTAGGSVSLNTVASELNTEGLYGKSSINIPNNVYGTIYAAPSGGYGSGLWGCGTTHANTDSKFVLFYRSLTTNELTGASFTDQLYRNGVLMSTSYYYYCIDLD